MANGDNPIPDGWRQAPAAAGVVPGHRLRFLFDAHAAWQQLLADLATARHSLDVELYMLVDDAIGVRFVDALCDAASRGVEVRLLLDAVGSLGLSWRRLLTLQRAGVALRLYRPPWTQWPIARWLRRDHRKTVLVDGEVGYVLGMNVGENYFAAAPGAATWADAGVRAEGPLVAQLAAVFESSWRRRRWAGWTPRNEASSPEGLATAVVHGGGGSSDLHRRYLDAIRRARSRVWLAHAYFLPGRRLVRSLIAAARRGLDVRVLLPDPEINDVTTVALAADHGMGPLLAHGVRLFTLRRRMMHGKFAVIDDAWWTLGSANLDSLSRVFNLEANVVGLGRSEAAQLAEYFEELCAEGVEHDWQAWRTRPRWRQWLGRALWRLRAWL